ncbi:murein L,D-transpeptidase catalytic domain family protein [Botryobacter ruber]|uniref:murein L,D-transpeptidase catalytic domain family protein n=1 Tax=Botryobacter ruber TaxID=2171629 RepID=UPI000E0A6478|nr:murein L,D-transpeptidase catalytic domain family protein [Botryobacter ruber]
MIKTVITSFALCLISLSTPVASNSATVVSKAITGSSKTETNTDAAVTFAEKQMMFDSYVQDIYAAAKLQKAGLAYDVFQKALIGYQNFKQRNLLSPSKSVLTVIDFTKSSSKKRMWIIDLKSKKVLFNNLVAHGRNTGEARAVKFSNAPNSYMSSMGFYVTDQTYFGKHGLSLRLNGMDKNFNSNAMSRAIVVHGADYVSEAFVKQYGRLGRSLGCPSVPKALSKEIIELIKDNTCLYIHTADKSYKSDYLNTALAVEDYFMEAPMLAAN